MDIITDYLRRLRNERQKIAFTGTHSVGKTTIINHLAERSWCITIPECYRLTASLFGLLCNGDTKKQSYDTTIHCFVNQMRKEIEATKLHKPHIVCDRTVLDCFLYLDSGNNFQRINYKLFNDCRKMAIEHIKTYDIIYFIEYEEYPLQDDGFRNTDIENQKLMNQYLWDNFKKFPNVKKISYQQGMELQSLEQIQFSE